MKDKRNASIKTLIKEAELVSGSLDFVYNFYVEQSTIKEEVLNVEVDEFIEQRLLDKNDAFLNVVLAQYCLCAETLVTLFKKAREKGDTTLTLACISNTSVGRRKFVFSKIPYCLFGRNGDEVEAWFKNITSAAIDALFRNPTISDEFLGEFLEGKKYWSEISEERRIEALSALYHNERIVTPYDHKMMDGWAELLGAA